MRNTGFKLLFAFIAGALLPLAFAPFGAYILAILSPAVLAWLWQNSSKKFGFFSGFSFGLGLFGIGSSWIFVSIHQFSDTPLALAVLITLLFVIILAFLMGLQGLFYTWLIKRANYFILLLAFPSCWVLFEWIRSWYFTGFPWFYLGYSQMDSPLAGYAPIFGVYGVSWLCVATSVLLLSYFLFPKRHYVLTGVLLLSIWLGGYLFKTTEWTKPVGDAVTVALLQGNIDQNLKWERETQKFIIDRYESLSAQSKATTIIWPEASLPIFLPYAQPYLDKLSAQLKEESRNAIIGLPIKNPQGGIYNGIVAIGDDADGLYYKRHLVPFGEFVPFEKLLRGLVDFFDLPMSHGVAGPADQPLIHAGLLHFASLICYEIVYPNLTLENAKEANILLTISNDSWFGKSLGPHQHFQIARMRALELGRYLVRSTNNGITAIVNPQGQVIAVAPQFIATTLNGEVFAMQGKTPLYFLTHYFVLILSILFLLGAVLLSIQHGRHNANRSNS